MTIRVFRIEEPALFFGGNGKCLDPQVGLLKYGPHGGLQTDVQRKISIKAGIIGTDRSIDKTGVWLDRLTHRIAAEERSDTEYKGIDFPGLSLDGPLGFEISVDGSCIARIDKEFIRNLETQTRKERISLAVKEYCEKLDELREAHPAPQVILLPVDDDLMRLCKDPLQKTDKIVYQERDFGDPDSATAELFDFHNYLKAQAALRNFTTQMLDPKTLIFSVQKQSAACISWNFSVAIYYKATGIPWKLAEIDDQTCYIGVSFYNEISTKSKTLRASIAQVYMRTGESQVIRGEPFEWDEEKEKRSARLNSEQMKKIVEDSIELFRKQRDNQLPRRVVVHKSSRFSDEELDGCERACKGVDILDVVHVAEWPGLRAYHEKYDYPVVRGTVFVRNDEAMLFTSGFVPPLATYPGPSVPRPIRLICQRLDTSIESVCNDVMGLTKLDWNSSAFYTRMPVTIGVSRKVGAVMAEMVCGGGTPPTSYRFFM